MRSPFAIREDSQRPLPKEVYGWRIYALAISASWASAMFGYDMAFIGGTMSLPSFVESFGLDSHNATELSSNITSIFQAGAFFGSIFGFGVSERFGRRWNLILSGVVFLVGAFVQTFSHGSVGMMYAGRILTGLGVGSSSMIVPVYIAECVPHTVRGRLVGFFEIILQSCSLIGFWINYGVNANLPSNEAQWQIPFAVQIIPAGLLVICMTFMIESPRWLVKRGRIEAARRNLSWVRNLPADHESVEQELSEMRTQLQLEAELGQDQGSLQAVWKEMTGENMRFRVIFAMAMKWMSNLTGTNSLNYFSPKIFQSIGFTGTSTGLLATGVYGVIKTIVTLIFIFFFVDTWGRRPALLTGSVIAVIAMFYLGSYSKLSDSFQGDATRDGGAYTAIVMVYIYAAAYALSWNAMPWLFAAEVFPTRIRGLGMLVAVLNQWLAQFVIVYATPYMITGISYGTFFFFGAWTLVAGIVVYCVMPETKGFALEDMHYIFENGHWWAPTMRKVGEELRYERDATLALETGDVNKPETLNVEHAE